MPTLAEAVIGGIAIIFLLLVFWETFGAFIWDLIIKGANYRDDVG